MFTSLCTKNIVLVTILLTFTFVIHENPSKGIKLGLRKDRHLYCVSICMSKRLFLSILISFIIMFEIILSAEGNLLYR